MREKLIEILLGWGGLSNCAEDMADHLIANGVRLEEKQATIEENKRWIPTSERIPENFVSVLGYMTDAGPFPPVRECYTVHDKFYFPALLGFHPVSHWTHLPEPPKGDCKMDNHTATEEAYKNGFQAGMPKWNSVADCLPTMRTETMEDFGEIVEYQLTDPVLVLTDNQQMEVAVLSEWGGKAVWNGAESGAEYKVTHWMPLPELPKEVT